MFGKKRENILNYRSKLRKAVEYLEEGKQSYIAEIYQAFASGDKESICIAAKAVTEFLCEMTSARIMRLDEEFRQYTSMEWMVDWSRIMPLSFKKMIRNKEEYLWVVRLGTFHPNGYFREKCIRELEEDEASLSYLLLRLNDWVLPVRNQSMEAVTKLFGEVSLENQIHALPFLEKVKKGGRRGWDIIEWLDEQFQKKAEQETGSLKMYQIVRYDLICRKAFYRLLFKKNVLTKSQLNELLEYEKDSYCKRLIICKILTCCQCSMDEIDHYLQNKSAVVRSKALEYKWQKIQDVWPGVENFLLDKSKSIRETACYILHKYSQTDILKFYKEHLQIESIRISILGIGENGSEQDAEILMKYLQSEDEWIVCNTIKALGMLLKESGEQIYWNMLLDTRYRVSKNAFEVIRNYHIRYGAKKIYTEYLNSQDEMKKCFFVLLLLNEESWDRLPYLLQLYHYENLNLQEKIRRKIEQRYIYGKVAEENTKKICEILEQREFGLPEKLIEEIKWDLKYVTKRV